MTTAVRYFRIETSSWEGVRNLDSLLQRSMLHPAPTPVPELIPLPVQSHGYRSPSDEPSDAGETHVFDVLYKQSSEISPARWSIFPQRRKPPRIGIELVIEADTPQIAAVQQYLSDGALTVQETRPVSHALFTFRTEGCGAQQAEEFDGMLRGLFRNYPALTLQDAVTTHYAQNEGRYLIYNAIVSGPLRAVLTVHRALSSGNFSIKLGVSPPTFARAEDLPALSSAAGPAD